MRVPRLSLKRARPSPITLADRARDAGHWELAARHYREALDRNPHNPPIWVQYGHVMKAWGDVAEAERAYRKAIELNPGIADPHLQHFLRKQGGTDKAIAANYQSSAVNPALPTASQLLYAAPQAPSHYIRTIHGTFLCIDKATRRVQHRSEIDETGLPLLYFELEPETKYGFFTTTAPLDRFLCADVVALGGVLPIRRIQYSAKAVAFQHVLYNTFVSAWVDEQSSTNVVWRDEALGWEKFSLHRARCEPFPECYALATAIASLLRGPLSPLFCADEILSCRGADQDALLALCFDRLDMDSFVALVDTIRARLTCHPSSDGLLRRLTELRAASTGDKPFVPECLLQPEDGESKFWVGRVLPDLMAWHRDRNSFIGCDNHVRLDTDLDFLDRLENGLSLGSPGRLYNFLTRFTTEPTQKICAVATARNEGVYLLEWLAYHKSIGVETFFIYSNNNDDGSDALLRRLSEAGAIHWLESIMGDEAAPQYKHYNHALNVLPQILDYQWSIFLDIDEFFVADPHRFVGLTDYIDWQERQPVDAIGFNWVWISSTGSDRWSPDFVRSRFRHRYIGESPFLQQRQGGPDRHIKSIFRPRRFLYCQPHFPVTDWRVTVAVRDSSAYSHLNYYGGEGIEPALLLHPKAEAAWVNHYFYKSAEEFVWKRWRGSGNHKVSSILTPFWMAVFASQKSSSELVYDDRILRCGGAGFQHCYEALLGINGIPEILEEVRYTFCAELKRMKTQLLNDPAFLDHGDELVQSFLNFLRS
jgi:tetratricopeptide (TPR) repeat protein